MCKSAISVGADLASMNRKGDRGGRSTHMDPPPPSEPAAFKDLGEPSSPESRLHMLYVPNARGGSRSWTGRVET